MGNNALHFLGTGAAGSGTKYCHRVFGSDQNVRGRRVSNRYGFREVLHLTPLFFVGTRLRRVKVVSCQFRVSCAGPCRHTGQRLLRLLLCVGVFCSDIFRLEHNPNEPTMPALVHAQCKAHRIPGRPNLSIITPLSLQLHCWGTISF